MLVLLLLLALPIFAQGIAPEWVDESWRSSRYPKSEWFTGFATDRVEIGQPGSKAYEAVEKNAQSKLSESIVVTIQGSSAVQTSSRQTQKGETINTNYDQSVKTVSNAILAKVDTKSYFDKKSGYIYGFAVVRKQDLAEFYSAKINGLFSFAESELTIASQLAEVGKKKNAWNKIKVIEDSLLMVNYWENLLQTVVSKTNTNSRITEIMQRINAAKIALENSASIYLNVSGSEYVRDELPAMMQEKGCNCSIAETEAEADYAITVKALLSRCNKAANEQVYCWANATVSVFNSKTKKKTNVKIPEAKGGWTEGDTAKATEESFKVLTENLAQQILKEMDK